MKIEPCLHSNRTTAGSRIKAQVMGVTAPVSPGFAEAEKPPLLPDQPIVTIEPGKFWVALDLRGLWAYRELLYFLTWRDVKVRYKQTLLGATWAIIQPLFTMIIFTLLFGRLAAIKSDNIPYPIFAYPDCCGLPSMK